MRQANRRYRKSTMPPLSGCARITRTLKDLYLAMRLNLEQVGGLHTAADLARRWNVTRQAVAEHAKRPDFPEPVGKIAGYNVWFGFEADEWWQGRGV